MDTKEDWTHVLEGHPIFSQPKRSDGPNVEAETSLELSIDSLQNFTQVDHAKDGPSPSGRRQVMVLKDADLILAFGKEIRITSLGESKLSRSTKRSYKTLHTPNIQFEIYQISLNPSGKLLAVAGAFCVAVIVLPRSGFTRLMPDTVDCKAVPVGQFYHASNSAAPISKIDWHPWGEAGSTLMVMTIDGKLREYDVSVNTEEPQQVLSFVPERRARAYMAEDSSEREAASFTLGKGMADWGPLTIYAVMKSGDVYSICPYMPKNASIPSSFVHALECFVSAKQEFLSHGVSVGTKALSTLYEYQRKYISALTKQLPPGTVFPGASRSVLMHPPNTIKSSPARQGPFLLQPSPRMLEGSEGGDATDIAYLAFCSDDSEDGDAGTEHLGVVMIAFQDGKVDVCLDVEKVEARWESQQHPSRDLPMLAVYETIDLGLVSMFSCLSAPPNQPPLLDLLTGNYPVFFADPIHDDTTYVYHAFGVHALHLGPVLQSLAAALRTEDDDPETSLCSTLQTSSRTTVQSILTSFSVERKCSNPVVGLSVPNDVYLTYSIFILTSAMRITSLPLNIRLESPRSRCEMLRPDDDKADIQSNPLVSADGPVAYVSLVGKEPYEPGQVLSRPFGLPSNPRLAIPGPGSPQAELMLTADTLRYLGTTVAHFHEQIYEIQLAFRTAEARATLQKHELQRQSGKCRELLQLIETLRGPRHLQTQDRFVRVQEEQRKLLCRLDRMLQGLTKTASPELSEHETKWFEELKRMKEEIIGLGKYDEESLVARTRMLEQEYARLVPSLKGLVEKEKQRKKELTGSNQGLGFSQAFEFGERSSTERSRIRELEDEILKLAAKLEVAVTRPPFRQ